MLYLNKVIIVNLLKLKVVLIFHLFFLTMVKYIVLVIMIKVIWVLVLHKVLILVILLLILLNVNLKIMILFHLKIYHQVKLKLHIFLMMVKFIFVEENQFINQNYLKLIIIKIKLKHFVLLIKVQQLLHKKIKYFIQEIFGVLNILMKTLVLVLEKLMLKNILIIKRYIVQVDNIRQNMHQ